MKTPVPPPGEPRTGADNYVLGAEIARGGMGSIVEAEDLKLSRTVAVKVLLPDSDADEAMKLRFIREATVLSRLAHPNIVPIHDIVWEDGMPLFYTMKLVKGRTLQRILDDLREGNGETRRDFTLDRLLTAFRKVCDAVAFAHSMGVLHRDLKPENIMVGEFGEVLVMDWGVARILRSPETDPAYEGAAPEGNASRIPATRHGAVIGTPHFMSPEQARGEVAEHDERSDVFSLGAVLYALLTLRPPVNRSTMLEDLQRMAGVENPRPVQPGEDVDAPPAVPLPLPHCSGGRVPAALSAVAAKALAREKKDRFQSVRELAADIERYQGGFATRAEHAGLWKEFQLLVLRHKTAAVMLAVLLLVSIGFLIKVMASERRALMEKETARRALVRSAISLAESALREGNGPAMRAALADVPPELRDGTWSYLLAEADTSRPLPSIGIGGIDDLAAHPTRPGIFAAAEHGGGIVLFDVRSGERVLAFPPGFSTAGPDAVLRIAFSKTGDRLAIGRSIGDGIVIHDAGDGRKLTGWAAPATCRMEFSPDGTLLLQSSFYRTHLNMWVAATGALQWGQRDEFHSACFAGDGRHVASYSWGGQLRLLKADDGSPVTGLTGNYFSEVSAQPAGSLIVAGNALGSIRGFDVKNGQPRFEFQPYESEVRHVAFSPGGERFLTAAKLPDGRQALQFWNATSTRLCQTMTGGSGEIRNICLHPVSGELIVRGLETRVWESTGVPPVAVLRSGNANPSAVFWGSRDLLFAPGPGGHSATLQTIGGDAPVVKWTAETPDHGQPSVSAGGQRAAVGRYHSGHNIAVLQRDGQSANQIAALGPGCIPEFVRMSPDGDRVAVVGASFTQLVMIDVATGAGPVKFEAGGILRFSDLVWLDGGKSLAGIVTTQAPRGMPGSVEQVVLWDTATGRRLRAAVCPGVSNVLCAAPGGRRFAEAGTDRIVRLRDAATLAVQREFRAHNAPVSALAWHPARPILATASEDLVIRLWNLDDGMRLEELRGPLSPPNVLSFSPDGTRLATASLDGAARIWEPRCLAAW